MLPPAYQQPYQQLRQTVEQLQATLNHSPDPAGLKMAIAEIQKFFQTEIWQLDLQEVEPSLEYQVRSVNVEIDKQIRLLNMDALFLQTARQENTIEQRKQQMRDRLALLNQYCKSLLIEN